MKRVVAKWLRLGAEWLAPGPDYVTVREKEEALQKQAAEFRREIDAKDARVRAEQACVVQRTDSFAASARAELANAQDEATKAQDALLAERRFSRLWLDKFREQEKKVADLSKQLQALLVPVPLCTNAPDWTPENCAGLAAFVSTPPGAAFLARLQATAVTVAVAGAKNRQNTVHAAGMAAGWLEAVETIVKLSRVSGVQDTNNETPKGESDLLEQLSP